MTWSTEFDSGRSTGGSQATGDGLGRIAVAGVTRGNLGGMNAGQTDIWIAMLNVEQPGAPAGDFSGDGAVDNADLTLLLNHWGNPASPVPGGWNGTFPTAPSIDNSELTALLNGWGQGSLSAPPTHVPEPASVFLVALAASLFAAAHRSRKARIPTHGYFDAGGTVRLFAVPRTSTDVVPRLLSHGARSPYLFPRF